MNLFNLSIHRSGKEIKYTTCIKPTESDMIIPNDTSHPHVHGISSFNYLANRLNTYPIPKGVKEKEITL
jgi:hypothetical protein